MILTEYHMPDLSDLEYPLKPRLLILLLAFEDGKGPRKLGLYLRNFIRLIDKALREYQEARAALVLQAEECRRSPEDMMANGRTIYLFDFTDHLENCITTTKRLLRVLAPLKSDSASEVIPRETRRSIEAYGKSVTAVRDTMEHLAEKIHGDDLPEGEPIILRITPTGDGAHVGGIEIKFSDVATVLRRLHEMALRLMAQFEGGYQCP